MNKFVSDKIALGVDKEKPLQTPQLSAEYAKWRDRVLPNPTEQSYRNIPWARLRLAWHRRRSEQ